MLFLIRHRYPRLGAVLSVLSSVVFLALPLVKSACQRRATPPARS